MPRTGKKGSGPAAGLKASYKDLGKIAASDAAASGPQDDEDPGHSVASYSGGFGTRDGGFCHCARCLRRSGPLTDDPGRVAEDIAEFLADVDPDGTITSCSDSSREGVKAHHRLFAETTSLAVERGDGAVLKAILDCLLDASVQMELATLLAIPAAQHGQANLIYLLDEYSADWDERDQSRGGPPLMHAANNGHTYAVNALLECDADPEAVDFNGQTALMVAIFSDRAGAAEALLLGGAEVDSVDDKGRTALCHAARYGSLDCISVLAQYNADVFHVDNDGASPLDIAEDCSRNEAAVQIRRLQQRQRLRERREARLRDTEVGVAVSPEELQRLEEEARRNAEALLAEVENEAQRKAAKKPKPKKDKRKGKANSEEVKATINGQRAELQPSDTSSSCKNSRANALPEQSNTNGQANGQAHNPAEHSSANGHSASHSRRQRVSSTSSEVASGQLPELRQSARGKQQRKAEADGAENGHRPSSSAASDDTTFSAGRGEAGGRASQDGAAEKQPVEESEAASLPDPVTVLRQEWDDLLEEAASCKDVLRQAEIIMRVQSMTERCIAAGISVKYGKKVLGKLERVGRVRGALAATLDANPAGRERLADALEQARSLRSLIEPGLLADAEKLLERLNQAEAERIASAQAAGPPENSLPAAPLTASSQQQPTAPLHSQKSPSMGPPPRRLFMNGHTGPSHLRPANGAQSNGHAELANGLQSNGHAHLNRVQSNGHANGVQSNGHAEYESGQGLGMDLLAALFPQEQQMHNQGLDLSWKGSGEARPQPPAASFFGCSLFAALPSAGGGGQLAQHGHDPVLATDSNPLLRHADRVVGPRPSNGYAPHPLPPHWSTPAPAAPGSRPYLPVSRPSLDHILHGQGGEHMVAGRAKREPGNTPAPIAALNGYQAESWQALPQPPVFKQAQQHTVYERRVPSSEFSRQQRSFDGRVPYKKAPPASGVAAPTWEVPRGPRVLDADAECIVCMAAAKDSCCVPCGHVCMCEKCSIRIMEWSGTCPICRSDIQQVIRIPC